MKTRKYRRRKAWDYIAAQTGMDLRTLLYELYVTLDYSLADIAVRMGYSEFAVRKKMLELGIPLRRQGRKEKEREEKNVTI